MGGILPRFLAGASDGMIARQDGSCRVMLRVLEMGGSCRTRRICRGGGLCGFNRYIRVEGRGCWEKWGDVWGWLLG